ncbi:hypothetical protein TRICI_001289 [Trichomonascus ciferrii]|uniref:Mediator of RNA polymerase II transcription subunit 13 n=1 Tax=Trichomonascus ciferrii TaxID=44093 RepID=A0A642V9V6_9ASCO|nr:hypothetical protein TRICI_001289 [Trichomonascus ciferrii]
MSHAEWSIRRETANALVCLNNNELWTFSFSEQVSPPEPNDRFNLKETSTGLFLPSTLGSGDTTHPLPAPYKPLVSALKSLILHNLATSTGFVPFGAGMISPSGKIFHVEPSLSASGDLFVKMYYDKSDIRKFQLDAMDSTFTPKVLLIPSNILAEVIEVTRGPKDLSQFKQLLERTSCIDVGTRNNRFKTWLKIRMEGGSIVIWPLDLCYIQPSSQKQNVFDAQRFGHDDVFGSAESQIAALKAVLQNKDLKPTAPTTNTNQQTSSVTGHADLAASTATTSGSLNTSGNEITAVNPQVGNLAEGEGRRPSVYPTPPDPHGAKAKSEANTVESTSWVTPGGLNSETWGDMDEDLFGEDEEITEADFNFFDQPEEEKRPALNGDQGTASEPPPPVLKKEQEAPLPEPKTVEPITTAGVKRRKADEMDEGKHVDSSQITIQSMSEEEEKPLDHRIKRRKSIFSPLKFSSLISSSLDSKYSQGGRFFVPNPENNEDSSSSSASDDDDEEDSGDDETIMGRETEQFHSISGQQTEGQQDDETMSEHPVHYISMWTSILHSSTSSQTLAQPTEVSVEAPASNTNGGTNDHFGTPNDQSNIDSAVSELVQHIVWDNGLTSKIIPHAPKREAPDSTVIKRVSSVFPELQKLSLLDVLHLNTTSQVIHSHATHNSTRFGTPVVEPKQDVGGSGDTANDGQKGEEQMKRMHTSVSNSNDNDMTMTTNTHHQPTIEDPNNNANPMHASVWFSDGQGGSMLHSNANTPTSTGTAAHGSSVDVQQSSQQQQHSQTPIQTQQTQQGQQYKQENNSTIFPISVPFYSVIRAQAKMKARAPILRFWKVFGLTPQHGPKDLTTLMISPSGKGMLAAASAFLNFLKTTYEGCALGEMVLPEIKDLNSGNGIVPYACDEPDAENAIQNIKTALAQTAQYLPVSSGAKNICFIITDPFMHAPSLLPIIQYFFHLKKMWTSAQPGTNVFLQIVETKEIAAKDTVVMPSQYKMVKVALNMYDMCYPGSITNDSVQTQRSLPAFTLARIPPAKINFRLSASSSLSLLDEDTLMHVAYSVSKDKRWLTAAWTDQWGEISKVDAFHLRKGGGRIRSFEDVCAEIWDITMALIAKVSVRWRVALAKLGVMDESELSTWLLLSEPATSSKKVSFVYLLSANTTPSLVVSGDYSIFPFGKYLQKDKKSRDQSGSTGAGSASGQPTTPATPQRGTDTESPDAYGANIATPTSAGNANGDTSKTDGDDNVVVDVKDDSHGIILGNHIEAISDDVLNNSNKPKPLITGFILKPGLNNDLEHRLFEVSLVHCPTPYEGSMKSLLIHYRRLASLGDYTGVSNNEERGHVPWHIEAVDKMLRVLNYLELST